MSTQQLSSFCALGVRLGRRCGDSGNLGYLGRGLSRDMGCIASRVDCRLPGHDGVQRGAENSACIFRNAPAIQHQIHVPFTPATHGRMPAPCQLRNPRISRFCWLGLVVDPGFSDYRNGCSEDFCGEFVCDIRTASAIRAGGRLLIDSVNVEA